MLPSAGLCVGLIGPAFADPAITTAWSNMRSAPSAHSHIVQRIPANAGRSCLRARLARREAHSNFAGCGNLRVAPPATRVPHSLSGRHTLSDPFFFCAALVTALGRQYGGTPPPSNSCDKPLSQEVEASPSLGAYQSASAPLRREGPRTGISANPVLRPGPREKRGARGPGYGRLQEAKGERPQICSLSSPTLARAILISGGPSRGARSISTILASKALKRCEILTLRNRGESRAMRVAHSLSSQEFGLAGLL